MWYLEEINGNGTKYVLSESFMIGRTPQADLVLTSIFVSKKHCRIMLSKNGKDEEVFIIDLKSCNGIYVNKKRIASDVLHRIYPNDIIGMGIPTNTPENSDSYKVYKVIQEVSIENSTPVTPDSELEPIILSDSSSRKRSATSPIEEEVPAKVANIKVEEHCSIIFGDDNYSQANITIIDDDDDLFVDKIEPKLETITIEDSGDELFEYSSQFVEPEKVEDDIFILSSDDEEDNRWLQRLSQGSRRSPPLIIPEPKIEPEEIKSETELSPYSEIKIEPEQIIKPELVKDEIQTDNGETDQVDNAEPTFIPEIRIPQAEIKLIDICKHKSAITEYHSGKNEKSKYVKPPIIEAPSLSKPSTSKSERSRSRSKKSSSKSKETTKKRDDSSKRPESSKKHDNSSEIRKEKLKQIATEQIKNKPKEKENHKKESTTPKVKVATTSRSDLFLADVIKDNDNPNLPSNTKLSRFKIPKKSDDSERKKTRSSPRKDNSKQLTSSKNNTSESSTTPKEKNSKSNKSIKKTRWSPGKDNSKPSTSSENNTSKTSTTPKEESSKSNKSIKETTWSSRNDNSKQSTISENNTSKTSTTPKEENSKSNKSITETKEIVKSNETKTEIILPKTSTQTSPPQTTSRRSILKDIKNLDVSIPKKVEFKLKPLVREFEIEEGRSLTRSVKDNKYDIESLMDRRQRHAMNIRTIKPVVQNECLPIEELIWEFTNWDPAWLVASRNTAPMELLSKLEQNKVQFETFWEYFGTFVPLIMCEMFSYVKKQSEVGSYVRRVFQVHITTTNHRNHCQLRNGRGLSTIETMMFLSKQADMNGNHPKSGELVIIQLPRFDNNEVVLTKAFGYVTNFNKQGINSIHQKLPSHLSSVATPGQVLFTCTILTKLDPLIVSIDKPVNLRVVTRISTFMREFSALLNLPTSILMPLILNPVQNISKLVQYRKRPLISKHTLTNAQLDAVFQSCELSLAPDPKICIIHGPPGTGKSYVIVNIVLELLYGDDRYQKFEKQRQCLPKILICAPSNAAVDNVAIRLLEARKKITNSAQRFRMVRVGQPNSMDPTARAISLQNLCENHKKRLLFEEEKMLETEMNTFQNRMGSNYDSSTRDYSDLLLEKADVVCTTLGSCFNSQLERLSKLSNFRFTCCIMDESTQCCEPDSLLPLSFSIDTLILVGDPRQLPATVLSQDAKKYGYDQSLFGRFETCFKKTPNQIQFLDTQYRMHPEIAQFPNEYFYEGKLRNGPNVFGYNFPLLPYMVFNHDFLQSSNESNANEVSFTVTLVKAIIMMFKNPVAIGIIAPYNQQCSMIEQGINDIDKEWRRNIKTNTIDGFQGLERDIIIFSCVRTDGIGFLNDNNRLNVALTRARQALYIIVNFHSLQKNSTWNALKQDAEKRKLVYSSKGKTLNVEDLRRILRNKKYNNAQ